jgi:hypothetical protein
MQLIKNNPYRIIGLLAGATAKEQDKQIRQLKHYLAAEQEPEGDYSFPTLGKLDRTLEDVTEASSKLTLDNDKMTAALFWFYNGNTITDVPALESLKDGNIQECTDIWVKLMASGEVTKRNSSAYHNLSTLLLRNSFISSGIDEKILSEAISYKIEFLESEFVKDFITRITDKTFKINKEQIELIFLRLLQNEVERHGGISTIKFLEIINDCEFAAKEEFIKEFVNKPIEQIERKITDTRNTRKANKNDAIKSGTALFNQTKESLTLLKSVLGSKSIKYISISDKVSEEVLQCGIDYFKLHKDTPNDPGQAVMNLFKGANSLACGNIAKQRCTENIENLQEWINDKPNRVKIKSIETEIEFITNKLKDFQNLKDSIKNARDFAKNCKPYLDKIKLILGENDELYLKLSTAIVGNAQGMIVLTVNDAMERRTKYVEYKNYLNNPLGSFNNSNYPPLLGGLNFNRPEFVPEYSIETLQSVIEEAWTATVILESFDMSIEKRNQHTKNKESLKRLYKQVNNNVTFFGDTPIPNWIFWVVGIGIVLLLLSTCN